MQEAWKTAPVKNAWQSAPVKMDDPMDLVPTTEGSTVGKDQNILPSRSDTTAGDVFKREFREATGPQVGLDNYDAVHKYLGILTPIVNSLAMVGDTLMGASQGAAFAIPEYLQDKGLMSEGGARSLGRDLMGLTESAGIVTGITPTVSTPGAVRSAGKTSKLAENVNALEQSGVNPSLAVATESPAVRSVAGGVEKMPIVGGPLQKSADEAITAVGNKAEELINQVGTPTDDVGVGQLVRSGLKRFATSVDEGSDIAKPSRETSLASKANALYDKAGIDEAATIRPLNTVNSINPVVSKYSDEVFSSVFKNTNMRTVAERLNQGVELSYADLKQLRRDVWKLQKQQDLTTSVDSKDISNLYSGLTKDLEAIAQSQGKLKEFRRAEKFWAKSQERISKSLTRFAGEKMSDEQIYNRILQSAKEGSTGNIKSLRVLRNSLRKDEWGDIAATVFDRLGRKDGAFNANQFVTNYSKLSPQARALLTSQTPGLRPAFDSLAKATELLQRYDRARPRGSAPTQNAIGSIMAVAGGVESITSGGFPMMTALLAGTGRMTANMLASPKFVRLLARTQKINLDALQGKNISGKAEELTRDLYLLGASNDIAATDVKSLIHAFGPERAAAKDENKQESKN